MFNNYEGSPASSVWLSTKCSAYLGTNQVNGKIGDKIDTGFNSNEVCVSIFNNNFRYGEFVAEIRTGGSGGGDSSSGDDTNEPVISSDDTGTSGPNDGGDGGNKSKGKNKQELFMELFSDYLAQLQLELVSLF